MRVIAYSMIGALTVGLACTASDDDGGGASTTGSTTGGDELATTLPLTATFGDGSTSTPDATSTAGTTGPATSDSSGGAATTSTGGDSESSSGSSGEATYVVQWCRLQSPASVTVAPMEAFTVYGRFYVEGITDQSTLNDPDPLVVADVGWGADGSDPAADPWTWTTAAPNVGFDGNDWGEPNNDEYMADVSIDAAGSYDYAFRVSADGGNDWVYCDLDDLLNGGYTPDQAGDATVE